MVFVIIAIIITNPGTPSWTPWTPWISLTSQSEQGCNLRISYVSTAHLLSRPIWRGLQSKCLSTHDHMSGRRAVKTLLTRNKPSNTPDQPPCTRCTTSALRCITSALECISPAFPRRNVTLEYKSRKYDPNCLVLSPALFSDTRARQRRASGFVAKGRCMTKEWRLCLLMLRVKKADCLLSP